MLKILKTPEGKKFLIAVACVFIVAVCVVSKAAFQGVEDQYNLPMDTWDTGTVAKLAMRQPFVLFKGLTFQKLCLP
ncbi:DUF2534 family protein, partial [Klebsiella grimontii]|uniref:DUF2534 family protein n=2 Tax=Klebsiella grimontii TaxID=2058152 RepID=UPI002927E19F